MDQRRFLLQPRLQLLADMVRQDARLADIGTDHGYLPVWLLREGKIVSAIASDINEAPLEHAKKTAQIYGIEDGIEFRLCAGLDKYTPDEVNSIVISGMGGETIIEILREAPWTKRRKIQLLLQPMTKVELLRIWISDNGYCFTDERLVWDKNYLYPIFEVTGGPGKKLTMAEAYGGVLLEKDSLWAEYISQQMTKLRVRINGLTRGGRSDDDKEIHRLCHLYDALAKQKEKAHDNNTTG